jgi:hypothetical protein
MSQTNITLADVGYYPGLAETYRTAQRREKPKQRLPAVGNRKQGAAFSTLIEGLKRLVAEPAE